MNYDIQRITTSCALIRSCHKLTVPGKKNPPVKAEGSILRENKYYALGLAASLAFNVLAASIIVWTPFSLKISPLMSSIT